MRRRIEYRDPDMMLYEHPQAYPVPAPHERRPVMIYEQPLISQPIPVQQYEYRSRKKGGVGMTIFGGAAIGFCACAIHPGLTFLIWGFTGMYATYHAIRGA